VSVFLYEGLGSISVGFITHKTPFLKNNLKLNKLIDHFDSLEKQVETSRPLNISSLKMLSNYGTWEIFPIPSPSKPR